MIRLFTSVVFLMCFTGLASADQQVIVTKWYEALKSVDRGAFQDLMSEDAKVLNIELQLVQNKEEFIEALDNWEDVAGDLILNYSTDRVDAERLVAVVCYQFPSNAFTNRETFSIEDGKIFQLLQEKIKDGC